MLIKCCDVSNEVRPKEMSEPWVDCLLQEYFKQSELEKKKGLPVAPFMDKDKVTKPKAQIGFIKFVLIPMFQLMKEVMLGCSIIPRPRPSFLPNGGGGEQGLETRRSRSS